MRIEGDHIKVTASRFPFPTVCKEDQATDWFNSLQNCLHWNKRERQKSFAVVESHTRSKSSSRSSSSQHLPGLASSPRNVLAPLSRNDTHSPHPHPNSTKKSSSSSATSSDAGQDEVFGMFYDDDPHRGRQRGTSRRASYNEDDASISSLDSFDSDGSDSDVSTPDAFTGWTDEEIIKSRHMAHITKELERTSLKDSKKFATSEMK